MADVFISYAREDEAVARRVAKSLQATGLDVWSDANLSAHRAYSEEIERNLDAAEAVVVLWSATAAKSQWVRAEADFARNAGKLVQAQLDGVLPPIPFNQIQCADLKGWRGSASHAGWIKLKDSVETLVSTQFAPIEDGSRQRLWDRVQPFRWWAGAGFLFLLGAVALYLLLGRPADEQKPILAVLPFKTFDARDESLAAGMWEDTRQQIGRNPQIIVLGPNTVDELAKKGPEAARRAAAYILEANVRSVGDRIRVNANLVRTKDSTPLWSENFDRRLDDVFALQSEIAREIEGRIRGRLAKRGGTRPENIATSGEVYALYSDARAKIRKRPLYGGYTEALAQLRQVVQMDRNFAPAWATLAVAEKLSGATTTGLSHDSPERHARRAIALAPNLASAHAALAIALNLRGPIAEAEIRRAVALDPNDFESQVWLGNIHNDQGRTDEAIQAYSRAIRIEPMWPPGILAKFNVLLQTGNQAAVKQELDRVKQLGSPQIEAAVKMVIARSNGDLSEAARIGLAYIKRAPSDRHNHVVFMLWRTLLQLGQDDLGFKISPSPPFGLALFRNDPRGIAMVEQLEMSPQQLLSLMMLPSALGRVLITHDRGRELTAKYYGLKGGPAELEALMGRNLIIFAPVMAVALQDSGDDESAASILEHAERMAVPAKRSPRAAERAWLARIYEIQGRREEAVAMLSAAVKEHWLPEPPELLNDLALDPALARMQDDPRFERLRQQILEKLRRERAELGPISLESIRAPATR